MSRLEKLLRAYERFISIPWQDNLSGAQKIIFAIYNKAEEQSLRAKVEEFALATRNAHHDWRLHDLTNAFPQWMAAEEYRESYFQSPEDLEILLPQFKSQVVSDIVSVLTDKDVDSNTVVVLSGLACLFGFLYVSELVGDLTPHIRGRLLIFFPGDYDNNTYRFLDARDGWNYMAVPITA